jgi:hypothetical protein
MWDVATAKRICPPLVHRRTVRDVAFSPDGPFRGLESYRWEKLLHQSAVDAAVPR